MLTLTTPPVGEPLTLPDAKAALRVEHDADDALIGRMIATARSFVERRLDLAIHEQTWTLSLTERPDGPVCLRPGKVRGITAASVTYGSATRAMSDGEVRLRRSAPATASFDLSGAEGGEPLSAITVAFTAGWLEGAVPPELTHAIRLLTAHYYEERELFAQGRYVPVPHALQAHIEAFREVRL